MFAAAALAASASFGYDNYWNGALTADHSNYNSESTTKKIDEPASWNNGSDANYYPNASQNATGNHVSFWHTRLLDPDCYYTIIPNSTIKFGGSVSVATTKTKWFDFRAEGANSYLNLNRNNGCLYIATTNTLVKKNTFGSEDAVVNFVGGKYSVSNFFIGGSVASHTWFGDVRIGVGPNGEGTADYDTTVTVRQGLTIYNGKVTLEGTDHVAELASSNGNIDLAGVGKTVDIELNGANAKFSGKGKLVFGNGQYSTVTLTVNGGEVAFDSNEFIVCNNNNTTSIVNVAGGYVHTPRIYLGGGIDRQKADCRAEFNVTGGKVKTTSNFEIGKFSAGSIGSYAILSVCGNAGDATPPQVVVDGNIQHGAKYGMAADRSYLAITNGVVETESDHNIYVNGGSGGIYVGGEGTSRLSTRNIFIADNGRDFNKAAGGDFDIVVGGSGVIALEIGIIQRPDKTSSKQKVTLTLDGGTLEAKGNTSSALTNEFISANSCLKTVVTANGGTINTGGTSSSNYTVYIPADIALADNVSEADLTISGYGSAEFAGSVAQGLGFVVGNPRALLKLGPDAASAPVKVSIRKATHEALVGEGQDVVEYTDPSTFPDEATVRAMPIVFSTSGGEEDASSVYVLKRDVANSRIRIEPRNGMMFFVK